MRPRDEGEADRLWDMLYMETTRHGVCTVTSHIMRILYSDKKSLEEQVKFMMMANADIDNQNNRLRDKLRATELELANFKGVIDD